MKCQAKWNVFSCFIRSYMINAGYVSVIDLIHLYINIHVL